MELQNKTIFDILCFSNFSSERNIKYCKIISIWNCYFECWTPPYSTKAELSYLGGILPWEEKYLRNVVAASQWSWVLVVKVGSNLFRS